MVDVSPAYARRCRQNLELGSRREENAAAMRDLAQRRRAKVDNGEQPPDPAAEERARQLAARIARTLREPVPPEVLPARSVESVSEYELLTQEREDIAAAQVWLSQELRRERTIASEAICRAIGPDYRALLMRFAAAFEAARKVHLEVLAVTSKLEEDDVSWRALLPDVSTEPAWCSTGSILNAMSYIPQLLARVHGDYPAERADAA